MGAYGCYWHQIRKKKSVSHSKCGEKVSEWECSTVGSTTSKQRDCVKVMLILL